MGKRPPGFFIDELGDDARALLGPPLRQLIQPRFQQRAMQKRIAESFAGGGRVMHVCLDRPLIDDVADEVHLALQRAAFVRHHHTDYPIDIAPRQQQLASALTRLYDWLRSTDAARFHRRLVGWPLDEKALHPVQVQIARLSGGDYFPPHIDADAEGLAAVYSFSRDWGGDYGGELYFSDDAGRAEIVVPPMFNSLFVFRPKGAPHGVRRVRVEASRYTVTAFYLDGPLAKLR